MKVLALCALNSLLFAGMCVAEQPSKRPALAVVLVIDGLRPDSITPDVMPNLDRIKQNGVWYRHSHSVFPTVTRVNAASISTGTLPFHHGIVSNALYIPDLSKALLNDGDYQTLVALGKRNGGRVVGPKTIAEYFQEAGIPYVAVSSGSTGSAFLLNPMAPAGIGALINAGLEDGRQVAFPEVQSRAILSRFGPVKADSGNPPVAWTERVLRDYVFDTLRPQVLVDWLGQPDEAQHAFGVGSPEALAALRLVDQQIGLLLERLREIGLAGKTDLIVTCDHGFDYEPPMDTLAPLRDAGLRSDDVVVDNEGGASLLYVRDRAAEKIKRLVVRLQASESTNAVFVVAKAPTGGQIQCSPGKAKGFLPGTLALDFIYQCLPSHGPDIHRDVSMGGESESVWSARHAMGSGRPRRGADYRAQRSRWLEPLHHALDADGIGTGFRAAQDGRSACRQSGHRAHPDGARRLAGTGFDGRSGPGRGAEGACGRTAGARGGEAGGSADRHLLCRDRSIRAGQSPLSGPGTPLRGPVDSGDRSPPERRSDFFPVQLGLNLERLRCLP